MGIDIDGGIIVGADGDALLKVLKALDDEDRDLNEWTEDHEMERYSPWFDAYSEDCYFGFCMPNVMVNEMNDTWMIELYQKAEKFKEITGLDAELIGMQNVW